MREHLKLFSLGGLLIILATVVLAASLSNSPSACSGQWTNCSNAFGDNSNRATASVTASANKSGIWNNYGFSVADSASIDQVVIRADFFASKTNGYINVRVSGDGGATFGPSHVVGGNTAEQTFNIDVTNDLAWTSSKLNNSNLRVNVTCFKQGSGSNPTCNLDWLPINVTYTSFDFSVSASPSSDTIVQGESAESNITVTLLGGVSQNVALSVEGCPTNAICNLNPSSGSPTYTSVFTVITNASTPLGTHLINVSGTGDGLTRKTSFTLTINEDCTRANPTVLISPDTQDASAGSQLNYTTEVTNNDSNGCGSSVFSLTRTIPSGWTGTFLSNSLTISPGSSASTTFMLTSLSNSTAGDYNFNNTATNSNSSSFKSSDSAVYHVN